MSTTVERVDSEAAAPTSAARSAGRPRVGRRALGYALLVVLALVYVMPFAIQIATSFKTDPDAAAHPLSLVPNPFTLEAWQRLLNGDSGNYPLYLFNSVFVTVTVTAGRVFFDSLAGYALSRLQFRGRAALFNAILAVMAVPGVVLLIPKFLVLKQIGMYDQYSGMIVPLLVDAAGVFIMKQFFDSVPISIEEAARIDGAGVFRTFWSVVLPMARPALITLTILSFQGSWNEFTHFLVSTQSEDKQTLILALARLTSGQLGSGQQFPLKLAAALLATIPVALVFFAFQRHFVRGANEGGVKG
jgi:multiple sugar transport system permease protein